MEKPCVLFLSDFHLGVPNYTESRERENKIVNTIESHLDRLEHLYLMGDLFDFWFEYKHVVPKGYIRLLGCLANVADKGIPISIFRGNHDVWMWDYFEKELGASLHTQAVNCAHYGYRLHLHHGDGLGPGDRGYKFIKKIFHARLFQRLFAILHPDWGISIARYFSKSSSKKNRTKDQVFLGTENEWIIQYCKELLGKQSFDYLIFGHRHLPIECHFKRQNAWYYNLGEWFSYNSYGRLSEDGFELISPNGEPISCQVD